MSLRHILLGLLSGKTMSGYELTKSFGSSLAFVWSAQHSQIYPELKRLSELGFIEQVDEGPRGRKSYAVTPEGLKELRAWLLNVDPDRTIRDQSSARVFFLWQLLPAEAIAYLEKERVAQQRDLATFEAILAGIEASDDPPPWGVLPVRLGIVATRARIDWIDEALTEFRRRAEESSG